MSSTTCCPHNPAALTEPGKAPTSAAEADTTRTHAEGTPDRSGGDTHTHPDTHTDAEIDATTQPDFDVVVAAARDSIGFADRDTDWDAQAARRSLQTWASGSGGEIDWNTYGRGFLYVAPARGGHTLADFKLPYAKVVGGRLVAVLAGVQAAASAVAGARAGLDIPSSALGGVKRRINALYARAAAQFDDHDITSPLTAAASAGVEADEVHLSSPDGQPYRPRADWFSDPGLSEYTRLTVTPEGRVFGHVADWNATHISFQGRQVRVPRSHSDYAWFHRRAVRTDGGDDGDGDLVRVGQLTFGPGHAGANGSLQAAVQHYDATCAQGAVVHAGEDAHGIWIAGSMLPTLTLPERNQVALADLSGDWRHDGRNLEMVAAHCVGVPGFLSSRDDSGRMRAMAADAAPDPDLIDPVIELDETGSLITLIACCPAPENPAPVPEPDPEPDPGPGVQVEDPPIEDAPSNSTAPEGGSGQDDGTGYRALTARRRMAVMRQRQARSASAHPPDTEATCKELDQDIDALVASLDPHDPETMLARVLAAAIRHGGNAGGGGSLSAASAASLNRSPRENWVDRDSQGLPPLVRRVARHIERNGRPLSVAIPAAINWVKHICSTGDVENWPGLQRVNPVSRAAACRAVAQWNALKARN